MFNFFKSKKPNPAGMASCPAPNVSLSKRRVAVSELKRGMHVCELDRPWSETSFPFRGFTLHTDDDISAVQDQCEYVLIDSLTYQSISQAKKKSNRYLIESDRGQPDAMQFSQDFTGAGQIHKKLTTR